MQHFKFVNLWFRFFDVTNRLYIAILENFWSHCEILKPSPPLLFCISLSARDIMLTITFLCVIFALILKFLQLQKTSQMLCIEKESQEFEQKKKFRGRLQGFFLSNHEILFYTYFLSWILIFKDNFFKGFCTFDISNNCLNSQYFWQWTNANPMKIFRQAATASKL